MDVVEFAEKVMEMKLTNFQKDLLRFYEKNKDKQLILRRRGCITLDMMYAIVCHNLSKDS